MSSPSEKPPTKAEASVDVVVRVLVGTSVWVSVSSFAGVVVVDSVGVAVGAGDSVAGDVPCPLGEPAQPARTIRVMTTARVAIERISRSKGPQVFKVWPCAHNCLGLHATTTLTGVGSHETALCLPGCVACLSR